MILRPDTVAMDARFVANSAAAGASVGLLIMCGYTARTMLALRRNRMWGTARDFLGLRR
jgi:hypothetical protein